jgi:hypothetical protein
MPILLSCRYTEIQRRGMAIIVVIIIVVVNDKASNDSGPGRLAG